MKTECKLTGLPGRRTVLTEGEMMENQIRKYFELKNEHGEVVDSGMFVFDGKDWNRK